MSMSPQQTRFIGWLLTSRAQREPQTAAALAAEMGLSSSALSAWKRDEEFLAAWNSTYLRTIGNPGTKMEIMDTLLRTATDPDDPKHVTAAKAFFEIEGSLRPQTSKVDIKVSTPTKELSDEDLKRLMGQKANDELAKRRDAG